MRCHTILSICCFVAGEEEPEGPPSGAGGDYFVPWHVPFHRASGTQALRHAQSESAGNTTDASIDHQKGAVVFKRYYHLYDAGELEGLIARVSGIRLVASFFDKSNWCCVFERLPE